MENLKNKLKLYIDNNLVIEERNKVGIFSKAKSLYYEDSLDIEYASSDSFYDKQSFVRKETSSIKDFIDEHDEYNDFQTTLFKFIDDRELKDSDVYNKVHIDRRLFSKIRSDKNYHPSKETIILLAVALELSESELDELLESASYSLPKNNNYDLIIRFCFINKIYKLSDINELLDEYNCRLFSY